MTDLPSLGNVAIIGAGCAGLSAAIYAARANLNPVVYTGGVDKGGLLVKTSVVENYPGFPDGIMGRDLIENMENQAVKYGTTILESYVTKISVIPYNITNNNENKNYFGIECGDDVLYYKSVIIATGSSPNKLKLDDEDKYWGNGISSCAICDGACFKRKKIIVVGGGDSAMEEASFLTKFSDVTLIHRGSTFRASKIMQERVFKNDKISIIYDSVITKFEGNDEYLTHIHVLNVKTNETQIIPVDGLFYGLGLKPNTSLFTNLVNMDENNYILTREHSHLETATSVNGIFVAGDAHDKIYRQAIVACGEGCKAALDVEKYLLTLE